MNVAQRPPALVSDEGGDGRVGGPVVARRSRRPRGPAVLVVLVLVVVAALVVAVLFRQRPLPSEGVRNGSVTDGTAGWRASSAVGPVSVTRREVSDGPAGIHTVAELRGDNAERRAWALATVSLDRPTAFLKVRHAYRLRMWVRNLTDSSQMVGLLLANESFRHRPTEISRYASFAADGWHELSFEFTATHAAAWDTAVYLALPLSGPIRWQATGVSLREVDAGPPQATAPKPDRILAFTGEAGNAPNGKDWNYDVGGGGWGNGELETYTTSRRNASVDGKGQLAITARRERATGPDGVPRDYTSARLNSQGKVEVSPGSYVEAPIRAPAGQGVWPAFWLLGSNVSQVGWPACGELDVLEVVGSRAHTAQNALHMAARDDPKRDMPYGNRDDGGSNRLTHRVDKHTHVYGVYFDKDIVIFYIDHEPTLTITAASARATGRSWPFDKKFFLVLNVAVGGRESPQGTVFPRTMRVGTVSVWSHGVPF